MALATLRHQVEEAVRRAAKESAEKDKERKDIARRWDALYRSAKEKMRLFGPLCGVLPNGLGKYRIHIPYFELRSGSSIVFFHENESVFEPMPEGVDVGVPSGNERVFGWRGFLSSLSFLDDGRDANLRARRSYYSRRDALEIETDISSIIEFNLTKNAKISVNRDQLSVSPEDQKIISGHLDAVWKDFLLKFLKFQSGSSYLSLTASELDGHVYPSLVNEQSGFYWMFPEVQALPEAGAADLTETGRKIWRPIKFPVYKPLNDDLFFNRTPLQLEMRQFDELAGIDLVHTLITPRLPSSPSRVILGKTVYGIGVALVYESNGDVREDGRTIAEFPPNWLEVAAINGDSDLVFNKRNGAVASVAPSVWNKFLEKNYTDREIVQVVGANDPNVAIAFLLYGLDEGRNHWNKLKEDFPAEFDRLFALAGISCGSLTLKVLCLDQFGDDGRGVLTLSSEGAFFEKGLLGQFSTLNLPDDGEWWLDGSDSQISKM